jgi:hypothetical protein
LIENRILVKMIAVHNIADSNLDNSINLVIIKFFLVLLRLDYSLVFWSP